MIDKKLDFSTFKECRGLIKTKDKLEYCQSNLTDKEKVKGYCESCRSKFFVKKKTNFNRVLEHI